MRVLVSGYYGFGNAGDEAILAGMVEGFRQRAPETELTVLSGNPEATRAEHGVPAVPRGLSSARAALRHADLFVSGGGGLLQDATSWRSPLYYLGLLWLARRAHVPVACLGQSVGPLTRPWIRSLVRNAFAGVQVLAVREQRSEQIVRELGVRRKVHVTGDLAFLLPPPDAEETARVWEKAGLGAKEEPTAALALRRLPHQDQGQGRAVAETAVAACRRLQVRPVLVPMQHPDDLDLAEEVAYAVNCDLVRLPLTAREVLALLGGFDLVIAMRLHALILAAVCGRPLVAVSYDPKVEGLLDALELSPATTAQSFEADQLTAAIEGAWRMREALAQHIASQVEHLRSGAGANIELAQQVFPK